MELVLFELDVLLVFEVGVGGLELGELLGKVVVRGLDLVIVLMF